jgi:hypothetical protein
MDRSARKKRCLQFDLRAVGHAEMCPTDPRLSPFGIDYDAVLPGVFRFDFCPTKHDTEDGWFRPRRIRTIDSRP